jgi:hypothetical protein
MIIVIDNLNYGFHFEIIESVIQKYNIILKIQNDPNNKIYLENIASNEYVHYINKNYPNILVNKKINDYDYKIFSTFYSKEFDKYMNKINNPTKYFFIGHDINDKLKKYNNIFYITPLCNSKNFIYADILPKIVKKVDIDIPIYVIQGNFTSLRRNYNLLWNILKNEYDKKKVFKIKFLGRGSLPQEYEKYKDKIIIKSSLGFVNYHNEFNDCYCILPLITKKSHSQYYTNKLTSTISYAKAYNLKCLIDKDLQDIYHLNNVEIFNDENDIAKAFKKTLDDFYINNKNSKDNNKENNIWYAYKSNWIKINPKQIKAKENVFIKTNKDVNSDELDNNSKKIINKGTILNLNNNQNNNTYYIVDI